MNFRCANITAYSQSEIKKYYEKAGTENFSACFFIVKPCFSPLAREDSPHLWGDVRESGQKGTATVSGVARFARDSGGDNLDKQTQRRGQAPALRTTP